jgi:hypothetical protein
LAGVGARIGSAAADPFGEIGDLTFGELLVLGRHLQILVLVADGLDEERFIGLAGHKGGPGVAAGEGGLAGVEEEPAADPIRLLAVAGVTLVGEDGADAGFEELQVGGGQGGGDGRVVGRHRGGAQRRGGRGGQGEQRQQAGEGKAGTYQRRHDGHARRGLTTLPATSVRRKSRPLKR